MHFMFRCLINKHRIAYEVMNYVHGFTTSADEKMASTLTTRVVIGVGAVGLVAFFILWKKFQKGFTLPSAMLLLYPYSF